MYILRYRIRFRVKGGLISFSIIVEITDARLALTCIRIVTNGSKRFWCYLFIPFKISMVRPMNGTHRCVKQNFCIHRFNSKLESHCFCSRCRSLGIIRSNEMQEVPDINIKEISFLEIKIFFFWGCFSTLNTVLHINGIVEKVINIERYAHQSV